MKAVAQPRRSRRTPMERDRYRAVARVSGVRPRLRRPIVAIDAALIALAIVFVLVATPRIAGALGSGADDLGTKLGEIFPTLQDSKPIAIPTTAGPLAPPPPPPTPPTLPPDPPPHP